MKRKDLQVGSVFKYLDYSQNVKFICIPDSPWYGNAPLPLNPLLDGFIYRVSRGKGMTDRLDLEVEITAAHKLIVDYLINNGLQPITANVRNRSPIKQIPDYPHLCPSCGRAAYIGIVPGSKPDCQYKCAGSLIWPNKV